MYMYVSSIHCTRECIVNNYKTYTETTTGPQTSVEETTTGITPDTTPDTTTDTTLVTSGERSMNLTPRYQDKHQRKDVDHAQWMQWVLLCAREHVYMFMVSRTYNNREQWVLGLQLLSENVLDHTNQMGHAY